MKLNIAQCRSAKKTAAPRGLRRSARISSSSASSSCSQQHNSEDLYPGAHCFTFLPLSSCISSSQAPRKATTFTTKREVSRHGPSEADVSEPKQAVKQTIQCSLDTQLWRQESSNLDDGVVAERLSKQRSFTQDKTLLTRQRSFKQENINLVKQRSFRLDLSTEAGISRQTSLKIEALIEPRVLTRTSSCTTIGRKRVVGVDDLSHEFELRTCSSPSTPSSRLEHDFSPRKKFASPTTPSTCLDRSPSALLTVSQFECLPTWSFTIPQSPSSLSLSMNFGLASPNEECSGDSLLEELPFDLLLRIVCCLEHDDLRPVSLVCKRLLRAVLIAQQSHFCFTTPHREKKGKRTQIYLSGDGQMTSQGSLAETFICPPTPNAPRHSARPAELRLCDVSPFEPCFTQLESSPMAVDGMKSLRMGVVPHRALFDEDELCEAVAQNSL